VKMTPLGADATGMVAAGGADLAVMPISEIVHVAGVELAGSLPLEIQFVQTFSAAIVIGTKNIDGSKRLISLLASSHAHEAIRKSGMEPVTTSK
jgi:molybdate transport system substrate-binding protein